MLTRNIYRYLVYLTASIVVILAYVIPFFVFAQNYEPISPLPGSESIDISDPESFFTNLFGIFIVIASMLAVIRLTVCGIQYMTSEAIGTKEGAKKCIWAVIGGIALLLLSWLILNTINPDLLNLQFDSIKTQIQEDNTGTPTGDGSTPTGDGSTPTGTGSPTINSFNVSSISPISVIEGVGTVTVSWDAAADNCQGVGFATTGIGDPSGNITISAPISGTGGDSFTYSITCTNTNGDSVSQDVDVKLVRPITLTDPATNIDETFVPVYKESNGSVICPATYQGDTFDRTESDALCFLRIGGNFDVNTQGCCVYTPPSSSPGSKNICYELSEKFLDGSIVPGSYVECLGPGCSRTQIAITQPGNYVDNNECTNSCPSSNTCSDPTSLNNVQPTVIDPTILRYTLRYTIIADGFVETFDSLSQCEVKNNELLATFGSIAYTPTVICLPQ